MLKNVVLPAPLGPMIETIDFSGTSKETSLLATSPPNTFDTFVAARRAGPVGRAPSAGAVAAPPSWLIRAPRGRARPLRSRRPGARAAVCARGSDPQV